MRESRIVWRAMAAAVVVAAFALTACLAVGASSSHGPGNAPHVHAWP